MPEKRKPFEIQIELNEMISKRIDLNDQWLGKLTQAVKEMSQTIAVLKMRIDELESK
jgi:hypothetical protein